jgi:ketosteroid isomerase-like protein
MAWVLLLACVLVLFARPGTDRSLEVAHLASLERQWFRSLVARRMDAVGALYAADARLMLAHAPVVVGSASIAAVFSRLAVSLPRFRCEFQVDTIIVSSSGEVGVVRGSYRFVPDSLEPSVFDIGKYVDVWTRREGSWRITADITNSDRPLPGDLGPRGPTPRRTAS